MREHYLRVVLAPLHGEDAELVPRRGSPPCSPTSPPSGARSPATECSARSSVASNWAVGEGLLERVATAGIKSLPEKSRERVLSLEELRRVWTAAGELGALGAVVRLLALSASARARSPSSNGARSISPPPRSRCRPARVKNERAHVVPLPRQAVAILEAQPRDGEPGVRPAGLGPGEGRGSTRWCRSRRRGCCTI